jgi:CRP-like cAMP-binding protein
VSSGLNGFPLLSELTADERSTLEARLESRELDSGSTLYRAGEEADALYFVVDGLVSIRTSGQILAELAPGEVLGALSTVSIGKRECDVVSATKVRLLALTREDYLRLRDDLPALALRLQEAILRSFSMLVRGVLEDSRAA